MSDWIYLPESKMYVNLDRVEIVKTEDTYDGGIGVGIYSGSGTEYNMAFFGIDATIVINRLETIITKPPG